MRGLKFKDRAVVCGQIKVAPYTGAWIEIVPYVRDRRPHIVAPYTGAWIEIFLKLSRTA